MKLFTLILLSFFLTGCCSFQTRSMDIPFVHPNGTDCANIALQEVVQYYFKTKHPETSKIKSVPELIVALREAGLHPELIKPSIPALVEALEENIPVILILKTRSKDDMLHCVVVTSIEPVFYRIRVHDKKPNTIMSLNEIKRKWSGLIKVYSETNENRN